MQRSTAIGDSRLAPAALLAAALLLGASGSRALVVSTDDPTTAAAFAADADLEEFEGLAATALTSYDPGQLIDEASRFHSRDSATQPVFNSGGGSPGDPVGNPGAPIGIVAPSGGIAGDVVSGSQVAAPLVIFTDEPWNGAFLEVLFVQPVSKVGFWIPHGSVNVQLRDQTGNALTTGDFEATGDEGTFLGFERDDADVYVVALVPPGGVDAFTIDDFVWERPVPEPGAASLLVVGALTLAGARRMRRARLAH